MQEDIIDIEITENGTIKSTTPKISSANHSNAHEFFKFLSRLAGGGTNTTKNKHGHTHTHNHEHLKGGN